MPYVLPRFATSQKKELAFILAFGDLSYLEICTVYSGQLSRSRRPWSDVAFAEFGEEKLVLEGLAGVHKVAVPITDGRSGLGRESVKRLQEFLRNFENDFNFSVSLYSPEPSDKQQYEEVLSTVLAAVRDAGFRKANMVRPRNGTEVLAREIASRGIIDVVVIRLGEGCWLGATSFVPDTQQFQVRSNERPVVSSEISISSRLARLLLNLSGVKKGEVVLDPFCGAGTILSEAVVLGADCIGIDRDPRRIESARRNLEWLSRALGRSKQTCSLGVGDAMKLDSVLPGASADAVVTEPILLPRIDWAPTLGRARKMVKNSSGLYSEALYSIANVVKRGGRVVIVTPSVRTSAGKDVSVLLENVEEARLRPFRPGVMFDYPVRISNENTRWIRRLVYVFEKF